MKTFKPTFSTLFTLITFLIAAQDVPNFYSIKAELDTYYDSLIQIRGTDSMDGTGYKPFKRWVGYWEPKLYPQGDFAIYRQELDQYCNDFISGNLNMADPLDWDFIGPDSMPQGSNISAKGLGQIHFIAFDPNDNTNQKMFACSPVGGLWRSLDGGNSWFNAGTDHELPLCGVSSIAIDPENSDTHWFISTGNGEAMPGRMLWQNAIGIWRTINGGNDWEMIGLENVTQMRKVILLRYQNQIHLLAATTNGLYECEDALDSEPLWLRRIEGNFYDVEADPQYNGIAYASGTSSNTSIYKIDIINNDYSELPNLSIIPNEEGRRLIIEISPAAPDYLFIVATYWQGLNKAYLYRYNLLTYQIIPKGMIPQADVGEPGVGPERAMGWTISPVIDINNELIMIHGNTAPIRLTSNLLDDEPCIWTNVTSHYSSCEIHVDMHYMLFESNGETLWVGSDGGIYNSSMPDLINNWEEKCNGLAIAKVYHLAISEGRVNVALSGAFDCGANFYQRGNNNPWTERHVKVGDGYKCFIDWNDPYRMIVSVQNGKLGRSLNGGETWSHLSGNLIFETYLTQNNTYPDILYGVSYDGVRKSDNFGTSWYDIFDLEGIDKETCWRVINSPTHENIIYTSWCGNDRSEFQKIFKTETGGIIPTDWEDVGSPLINEWINSIAVDYFNPHHIWVSAKQHVYDVNTITKQWIDISDGIPNYCMVEHLEILKGMEGVLYASTTYGLFYYDANLGYWQFLPDDLPNAQMKDVQIDNENNRIAVALFGRGIWETDLPCIGSNQVISITSNETWDSYRRIEGMVYIEPGATLEIVDTQIKLGNDTKIIIKPGGYLILNGCELSNGCKLPWQGIEVEGNPNLEQTPTSTQGMISIVNESTIENAKCGILLIDGGIVVAESANFINNHVAVEFLPYQYENFSSFTFCDFETNDDCLEECPPDNFVVLTDVNGISFYGCTFNNTSDPEPSELAIRGNGIFSTHSGFLMDYECIDNSVPCEEYQYNRFEGLHYGIYAAGYEFDNTVSIRHTEFVENVKGLYMSGFQSGIEVTSNDFNLYSSELNIDSYGMYLDICSGYHVEDNSFHNESVVSDIPGLYINNSGTDDNMVYNNRFEKLDYAIVTLNINRDDLGNGGLCLKCNDFEDNANDILVLVEGPNVTLNHGIAEFQGTMDPYPDAPAGNTFTNSIPHRWDIYNEGNNIEYIHHLVSSTQEKVRPDSEMISENVTLHENSRANYSKEISCPSMLNLGEGGAESMKSIMAQADTCINNTISELSILVDGGDTEEMNTDVLMSLPDEALEIHEQMLGESPYLSDTVMKSAIYKEDVLPNAMIRDVLVANPQSAKSEELLEALNERAEPMPDYMMAEILGGRDSIGSKEVLNARLSDYRQEKSAAFYTLVTIYQRDTVNEWAQDSLIAMLGDDGTPEAKYGQAFLFQQQNDAAMANAILESIPDDFQLTDEQLETHAAYLTFIEILQDLQAGNLSILQLDSLKVNSLQTLSMNNPFLPGIYATMVLKANGLSDYEEPVILRAPYKSVMIKPDYSKISKGIIHKPYLKIYPNPAGEYFIAEYHLEKDYRDLYIEILDGTSRTLAEMKLKGMQNQVIIPVKQYPTGMYLIRLIGNGEFLDSQKIMVAGK